VACSLRSGRFFDHDFSNQRDGYTTSENTLVEKSYFTIVHEEMAAVPLVKLYSSMTQEKNINNCLLLYLWGML